jgi:peroxiredoxin
LDKIKEAGIQLIAVSYDPVETLKEYSDKNDIKFPLVSDEGSKTIDAYGIRNTAMDGRGRFEGIPYPGTYLLDKDGVIRAKLFLERYQERHTTQALLDAAKEMDKE